MRQRFVGQPAGSGVDDKRAFIAHLYDDVAAVADEEGDTGTKRPGVDLAVGRFWTGRAADGANARDRTNLDARVGVGQAGDARGKVRRRRLRTAEVRGGGNPVAIPHFVDEWILAERVVRHPVGRAIEDLLAVVTRKEPRLVIDRLPGEIGAAHLRLGEIDRIGDDRHVCQVIAVTNEELDERRLIAFWQAVAAKPALFEMRGLYLERLPDEASRREPHPGVRRPARRMRTSVHPDGAVAFEGLVVPVNGDQSLRVRVAFFPRARVADRAHRIGRDVAVALVVAKRDA